MKFCAALVVLCLPALAAPDSPPEPTIDAALERLYNFDFPGTYAALDRFIDAHPQDPLPFAFRASAHLFYELDRLGILEAEFLSDDDKIIEKKKPLKPDPANREQFLKALEETRSRGNAALKANPNDVNALFAMTIADGVTTDYMALVEKHQISSLTPARRSNSYAQRLLQIDPKFYDAYLTAGFSEYMIGSLPFFLRWFIHFDNVTGSKERGIAHVRMAADHGHYFKAFAKILLGIADLRDKRPQDAQKLLAELARDYPQNPLFRTELAKLNTRLGYAAN